MLRKAKPKPQTQSEAAPPTGNNGGNLPIASFREWTQLDGIAVSDGQVAGVDRNGHLIPLPPGSWTGFTFRLTGEGGSDTQFWRIPSNSELAQVREQARQRDRQLQLSNLKGEVPSEEAIIRELESGNLDVIQAVLPARHDDFTGRRLPADPDGVRKEVERRKARVEELKRRIATMEADA